MTEMTTMTRIAWMTRVTGMATMTMMTWLTGMTGVIGFTKMTTTLVKILETLT